MKMGFWTYFNQFLHDWLRSIKRERTEHERNQRTSWTIFGVGIAGMVLIFATVIGLTNVSGWFGFGFLLWLAWSITFWKFQGWFDENILMGDDDDD